MKNALAFLAVTAALAASAAVEPTNLLRDIKAGDKHVSKLSVDIDFSGQTIVFKADMKSAVKEVKADGSIVLEESSDNTSIDMGNGPEPAGQESTMVSTYDKTGKLIDIQSDMLDDATYRFSNLFLFNWPGKAVDKGDTWEVKAEANKSHSTPATSFKYTVEGFEDVKGVKTIKVKFDIKETEGDAPATSMGTMWIDIKTGWTMKSEGSMKNVPVTGMVFDAKFKSESA